MAETTTANFQSCCRLCLSDKADVLKSVFDESSEDRALPQKISQFVCIQINATDQISKLICTSCILKVDAWHKYQKECQKNQIKLVQRMAASSQSLNDSCNNIADVSIVIKEEPRDVEEMNDVPLCETPENCVEVVMNVKSEPGENDQHMEEEYNDFPPSLTPEITMEISENGLTLGSENNRMCNVCKKLFSSTGNRRKHEKQIHGLHQNGTIRSLADTNPSKKITGGVLNGTTEDVQSTEPSEECEKPPESETQKIQFAAGLKLLQTNSTPISCEALSKIELSYIEKCKAMVMMHQTLECACHNVPHHNLKGLLSHLRALRIWFPVFTCYNCMITFTDRSTFTRHNVRCTRTSLETLTKLSNLKKRSEVKTRLYQIFRCTYCKFMYSFHDDYCKHVDEEHCSYEPPIVCSCSRRFDNLEDYKDHVYVSCIVEYYCDICFITTKTLNDFQKHAFECHDNSEGFVLLQDDNYKVRKPSMHMTRETVDENVILSGKRERRMSVKAPIYDEEYEESSRKVLNPAVLNPKSYNKKCPLCGKEYSSYNNMMRHYRQHFNGEKPSLDGQDDYYSCPECGGMYNSVEWAKHLAEQHDPKSCGECGKVFQFQAELDNHRSVHLNIKVFRDSKTHSYRSAMISPTSEGTEVMLMCEVCEVMFRTKEDLKEHKKIHDQDAAISSEYNSVDEEGEYLDPMIPEITMGYENAERWEDMQEKERAFAAAPYPKACPECDKVCTTGAAMHRHRQIHIKVPENASTKVPIIRKKSEIDEESYHTCKKCFKVFSSRYNLKNHMRSHGINMSPSKKSVKKQNEYVSVKQEINGDDYNMDVEQDFDPNNPPRVFTCDICVMVFSSKESLKKHKQRHIQESRAPLPKSAQVYCKYCKIPFSSIVALTQHMHKEHDESAKPKLIKTKEIKQFVCAICKKTFQTAAALTTHTGWHKRTQGPDLGKAAKLLKNNKIMNKLSNAANIKQEPMDVSKYQCTTCLADFPNDTALQVHILEKHRSVSAVMLMPRCNVCDKDFNTQEEYETHKRLHDFVERQQHYENAQTNEEYQQNKPHKSYQGQNKTFPCKFCNAGFSRSDTLGAHIRQFHKEHVKTEFRCTVCDRAFDKQNALTIHLKTHDKQKSSAPVKPLFSCAICNMGFDLSKDLRAHTINAHPF